MRNKKTKVFAILALIAMLLPIITQALASLGVLNV